MNEIKDFVEGKSECLEDLFISAGNRVYMVGAQDGAFPDFGHHIEHEMGGIWDHPIKLMDGFWLHIKHDGASDDSGEWVQNAYAFFNYPFYNEHRFELPQGGLNVIRRQFCPDDTEGLVVSYSITNAGSQTEPLTLKFLGRTDLRPVWFAENMNIVDGEDDGETDDARSAFVGTDRDHPWHVVFGADRPYCRSSIDRVAFGPQQTAGKGITGELIYEGITIAPGATEEIFFFIAGSYVSKEQALATFDTLKRNHRTLFADKRNRYTEMLNRTIIDIPDKHVQRVLEWIKFNNDWLVRNVPEIGNGLGAGHPEYSWWFGCDNSYALLGVLPLGDFRLANDTLELLRKTSEKENGNGRIVHEISTCGAVANKGNTQETPHFIRCVWEVFLWTGDELFLREMYPIIRQGIEWLLGEMDQDEDLLPEGYGIIEIEGLNLELIDTAVYTCEALRAASQMAQLFGEPERAERYAGLCVRLKEKINRELWLEEEGLYADAMGSPRNILQRLDMYIEKARGRGANSASIAELERMMLTMQEMEPDKEQPWLFKNWVINTPMEMGLAEPEQAARALERMATDEFTGPWGTYLSGLYRTHMMTISTGVQAVAEGRYDRSDQALRYVKLIASTFGKRLPGSISEMSPDYGCFVQAWTGYGIVWPVIVQMFGIRPDAYRRELTVRPRLPQEWNDVSAKRIHMGSGERANVLDLHIKRSPDLDIYTCTLDRPGWSVTLDLPDTAGARLYVDGKEEKQEHFVPGKPNALIRIPGTGQHVVWVKRD